MNKFMQLTISDIVNELKCECQIIGGHENIGSCFASIFDAKKGSITWLRANGGEAIDILKKTESDIIICREFEVPLPLKERKTFIFVDNPHLRYLKLVNKIYHNHLNIVPGIHSTAIISPEAKIGEHVYIGPFAIISNCTIGDYSVIKSHASIHSNVEIGQRVLISEYCNIGGQGFGYIKNEIDEYENMIHIGGLRIEDDVHIFPYTNIDQGTLSKTIISTGTKIDHFCHIGHNSKVGKYNLITPNVTLLGGASTGDQCYIGCGSVIRENITIGSDVTIGMCSSITKNIPNGQTWVGSPALEFDEFKLKQYKINEMLKYK